MEDCVARACAIGAPVVGTLGSIFFWKKVRPRITSSVLMLAQVLQGLTFFHLSGTVCTDKDGEGDRDEDGECVLTSGSASSLVAWFWYLVAAVSIRRCLPPTPVDDDKGSRRCENLPEYIVWLQTLFSAVAVVVDLFYVGTKKGVIVLECLTLVVHSALNIGQDCQKREGMNNKVEKSNNVSNIQLDRVHVLVESAPVQSPEAEMVPLSPTTSSTTDVQGTCTSATINDAAASAAAGESALVPTQNAIAAARKICRKKLSKVSTVPVHPCEL